MGSVSGRDAKLCRKMHAGETSDSSELGEPDRPMKIPLDVVLDAPQPPVWQRTDFGARKFETGEPHRQHLPDTAGECLVDRFAPPEQRLGELPRQLIAKQHEVVQ